MNAASTTSWEEANQSYLTAALAAVREALERHVENGGECDDPASKAPSETTKRALREAAKSLPEPAALDVLCSIFGLSPFERAVLLLCAGMELDSRFAACCAAAQNDPRRTAPTFALALAALPGAQWSALAPASPLRRWRLLEMGSGDTLVSSPLRIDERVLHHLAGAPPYIDDRLQGFVEPVPAPSREQLPASHAALARRIAGLWTASSDTATRPAIQLTGSHPAAKRAVAAAACAEIGMHLHALRAHDVPAAVAEREALARLWEREAVLSHSALLLDCEALEGADPSRPAQAFVKQVRGFLVLAARDPLHTRERTLVRFDVERPSSKEQQLLWCNALGPLAENLNGQVEAVVAQFNLDAQGIRAASAQLLCSGFQSGDTDLDRRLWNACRAQARSRLDDLARRIEPKATWDDLVLPEPQRQILRNIAIHLRHRTTVYERGGFAATCARGLGISALFVGPSGTGKTLASEVLANELRLDLYQIDLSAVVSKYIGETEKNLRRLFDAAEEGGAILLFDEADALFGKRSEVRDSHDRYANIEVSYLLQRVESYRGLAILTTNRKEDLDPAFLRRIRFVAQFAFPNAGQRAEIWRRVFPPDTRTEALDPEKLSRLNVAGGSIRNIAMGAAFLAADAEQPVRPSHVARAARSEYAKLEKPITNAELSE